ncbi:DnaA ATPase domain-containing protein [Desulfohalovibrio reitneri]|uniref:DnaA ATPase domain-containing protein n=1 Tax=Desulfohalovibrio reitneri TaxID=1307759 RepID=UPI001F1AF60A|nr:DnaA/Hda family protein [Desulfohalovibrio reitneri]
MPQSATDHNTPDSVKTSLRTHLEQSFSDQELKRWFDPLDVRYDPDEKRLDVGFPHAFFSSWFAQHVQDRFEEQMNGFFGPGSIISYGHNGHGAGTSETASTAGKERVKSLDFPFGNQFTFDSFLINKKNYFPLASAREVAKQDSVVFNPFVVCGEHGSGKTHLLKAIANEIARRTDPQSIYFGTVEDLAALFKQDDSFSARRQLSAYQVLVLDDFQLIQHSPNLQQELIILFNAFHDQKKQMVFGCADRVTTYEFLNPTLKSRLEWGLIVNLKQPDLEVRVRFIQNQCRQKKITLDKEQVLILAQRFRDFRYLQGILLKLFAYKELVNKDIGPKDFQHVLSHTEEKPQPALSPDLIIDIVSSHFGLQPKDLKGSQRRHEIVRARQMAMFLCREMLGSSYPALGRIFGGKDHSTALYAVNKIKKIQKVNKETKNVLKTLKQKCLSSEAE